MNSMKLVIPLHFDLIKKDSKRCCDTTTPESIHTKDDRKEKQEQKKLLQLLHENNEKTRETSEIRGTAFAFIFGVN